MDKPILTIDEQIEHLKSNGVRFTIMNEEAAKLYLSQHNNYFKLTAYRKNFDKHPDGENKGKYINLEFAYLVDMSIIDMKLRYLIVLAALDIEHHAKLRLLQRIEKYSEDGYQIVQDYISSLPNRQKEILDGEINRNKNNIYCGDIVAKYNGRYPIWAFIELIPFGRLISLYGFCADRFADKIMKRSFYLLLDCRQIRNAAAHSNCILNDLKPHTIIHSTDTAVIKALEGIPAMSKGFRKHRMSNARIQQLVTLLYTYNLIVSSEGLKKSKSAELRNLLTRIKKNKSFYTSTPMIAKTFEFLELVIDSWFGNM